MESSPKATSPTALNLLPAVATSTEPGTLVVADGTPKSVVPATTLPIDEGSSTPKSPAGQDGKESCCAKLSLTKFLADLLYPVSAAKIAKGELEGYSFSVDYPTGFCKKALATIATVALALLGFIETGVKIGALPVFIIMAGAQYLVEKAMELCGCKGPENYGIELAKSIGVTAETFTDLLCVDLVESKSQDDGEQKVPMFVGSIDSRDTVLA
ncbi:MAG: hypothetical protein HY860_06465 [Chlamydiales bacterium]|nr:hypothetical protein [Chlamydiales bacterium]